MIIEIHYVDNDRSPFQRSQLWSVPRLDHAGFPRNVDEGGERITRVSEPFVKLPLHIYGSLLARQKLFWINTD